MHTVFYNVHALAGKGDYAERDRIAALNMASAVSDARGQKIIYLGGLGRQPGLSKHLASRQEVGRILRESPIPTIELRASIIIGSGSLSFEMVRALVEKLPIMTTPSWVRSRAQPIAIEDVIDYLMEALDYTPHGSEIFEIGGADAISYEGIMREYAKIRGLKRLIIPIPFLTPGLSSHWLALVTPLYARVGRQLIEGVRNDTLVTDRRAVEVFSVKPRGIGEAIQRALDNEDREFAETRWTDAQLPDDRRNKWGGRRFGSRLMYTESISVPVKPEEAFLPIQYIGGETGWYSYPWLWSLRGFIDKLSGGVGGNRGRRDPLVLLPGDVVDFWRVEELIQYRMLRLKAEMKVPGRGWLQFDVESAGENQSVIRVTALFEPLGLWGLVYWYALYPFHRLIFGRMLMEIRSWVTH